MEAHGETRTKKERVCRYIKNNIRKGGTDFRRDNKRVECQEMLKNRKY